MARSIMLDLETLDTGPDAVILTFGAVKFSEFTDEEPSSPLYLRIKIDEQSTLGRSISQDTLNWWSTQDPAAQEEAFSEEDRVSLDNFTSQLSKYVVGADKVWAQGPTFDIVILENLYRMIGKTAPWAFWQIRDSRTLLDLGDDSVKKNNASAHNALADAYFQAQAVQSIYRELGVEQKTRRE